MCESRLAQSVNFEPVHALVVISHQQQIMNDDDSSSPIRPPLPPPRNNNVIVDSDGSHSSPSARPFAAVAVDSSSPGTSSPAVVQRTTATAGRVIADDDDSDSDNDRPLAARVGNKNAAAAAAVSEDDDDDSEDDLPIAQRVNKATTSTAAKKSKSKSVAANDSSDDDEDELPLMARVGGKPAGEAAAAAAKRKSTTSARDDSDADDSDRPRPPPTKKAKASSSKTAAPSRASKKKRRAAAVSSDDSDEDAPVRPAKAKAPPKSKSKLMAAASLSSTSTADSPAKKSKTKPTEDEPEIFKWWEQEQVAVDNSVKWTTLKHLGPVFPPQYEPHGVKMLYDGKPVTLSPASEEVAGFFAVLIDTMYAENPTFCNNFFDDFLEVLRENDPNSPIREFAKCDFRPMQEHYERVKQGKKQMSKDEKDHLKEEKKQLDAKYGWAEIDGRREKIGNFRIEPPGLFRGRGDHPKTGKLKKRVMPEQVTLNLSKDAPLPPCLPGHKWGGVVHENAVAWLATWTENVNGNIKYVLFAANSSLKGMSDYKKFEKARELKSCIDEIRRTYMAELRDKQMMVRQRATAMWLIDKLALRAGNEKGEDEADTVGCCSLRFEHITLEEDKERVPDPEHPGEMKDIVRKMVVFDFLGKDSIRYYNRVEVDPVVWKNLQIFKRPPKRDGDPIFDRLTTSSLNKHLTALMPGLTAKVFRTFNASFTFQRELENTPDDSGTSAADKILAYNRANRQVAILCNHQRTVPKAHGAQMEKLDEKILMMKYELHLVKKDMLALDPKLKKKRPELTERDPELDDEVMKRKAKAFKERELEKLEKRWEKACEKAKEEKKPRPEKPTLATVTEQLSQREHTNMARLEKQYESLSQRVYQQETLRTDKDENKTTALGTSKINYIDPRITAAWCAKHDVPIEKMFTKTLRQKFAWAMEMEEDWEF